MKLSHNIIITNGLIGAWILLLLWLFIFLIALNIYMKQKKLDFVLIGTSIFMYVLLQCHMRNVIAFIPRYLLVVVCLAISILGIYRVQRAYIWQRKHITNLSVKQAVDKIPFGVCYYNKMGRILLINKAMTDFCEEIIGEPVQNGRKTFEKILAMGSVIHLPGERAISIYSDKCIIDSEEVELVTAFDISEEYKKTNILMQKEDELKEINEKLTSYNKEMVSVIALREVLNAKVKIHDELGSSLLATKKYLLRGGTLEERNHLIEGLRKNVRFLRQESEEVIHDEYEMIMNTAADIGMQVDIKGELPNDNRNRHIIATAMHECLTNTIRHASGNTLFVEVNNREDSYRIVYTNNGAVPEEPISERGGLSSLRDLVEQEGGTMQITNFSQYTLIIELPKEKD